MNSKILNRVILFLSFLLNVVFVFLVFGQIDEHEIGIYIWSDTLYLPSIFKDLFIDGTGFGTWNLNGAPNFFPDIILYFIINTFTDNFIVALFVFSLIQYTYILLFSYLFIRAFFPKMPLYIVSVGLLMMLLFLFITTLVNNFTLTFLLVSVSFHLSAYVLTLVCAWQVAMYFRTEKKKHIIIYAVVSYLAALSDKLFIIIFSIPALLWLIFLLKKQLRRRILIFTSVSIFTVVVSVITYNLLNISSFLSFVTISGKTFQFENMIDSYRVLFEQHGRYIQLMDTRGLVDILALISLVVSLAILMTKRKVLFSKEVIDQSTFLELSFLIFIIGSSLLTFNAPAINGYYVSWALIRFNIYAIILLILNYSYLFYKLANWKEKSILRVILPAILLFIGFTVVHGISYSIKTKPKQGLSNFFQYHPEWVQAIDSVCVVHNIQYGLSEYVYAKHFTMFSEHDNRIYATHPNLRPWHHVTNEDWFYGSHKGKFAKPEFRFIITNKMEKEKIHNKFSGRITDTVFLERHNLEIVITEPFILERKTKNILFLNDSTYVENK
jgi:hypothetical protein